MCHVVLIHMIPLKKNSQTSTYTPPQLSKGYCCDTKLINCLCMERLVFRMTMSVFQWPLLLCAALVNCTLRILFGLLLLHSEMRCGEQKKKKNHLHVQLENNTCMFTLKFAYRRFLTCEFSTERQRSVCFVGGCVIFFFVAWF